MVGKIEWPHMVAVPDDHVVVVFTKEQAELAEVLFDDPHLYAMDDETKEVAKGGRSAVRAGLNAVLTTKPAE